MTEHADRKGNRPRYCQTGKSVQTSLRSIANKAKEQPEYRFKNLYGMIDEELLRLAWKRLNKKAVAGVDGVCAQEYGKNLDANLDDLIDRLKRNGYRARLVKRSKIPKGNGKTRPLGIPTLEDRLLQKAVSLLLEAVYEPTFLDSSYGYRRGRNPKLAVKKFRDALNFGTYEYVVEADIKGFFDHLSHDWLVKLLEIRVEDRKLMRLIRKWLKAGILESDQMVVNPVTGTPQGGIVSPMLANVYLHYALDLWVERVVKPQIKGKLEYVRYADDLICAFTNQEDAERFYKHLGPRLGKFELEVAEEKTRVLQFGRDTKTGVMLQFLGFELQWSVSRKGVPNLKRRTARKRIRRAISEMDEWIQTNRSMRLGTLLETVNAKLRGHYQFYGVIGNSKKLSLFFHRVNKLLFKWLNRRSQRRSLTWFQFSNRVRPKLLNPRVTEKVVRQRELFRK